MHVLASIGLKNRSLFVWGVCQGCQHHLEYKGLLRLKAPSYIYKLWMVSAKAMNSTLDLCYVLLAQFRSDTLKTNYMSFFSSLTL